MEKSTHQKDFHGQVQQLSWSRWLKTCDRWMVFGYDLTAKFSLLMCHITNINSIIFQNPGQFYGMFLVHCIISIMANECMFPKLVLTATTWLINTTCFYLKLKLMLSSDVKTARLLFIFSLQHSTADMLQIKKPKILGLWWEKYGFPFDIKKILLPVAPWGMRMWSA